jgi:hypothetical protein
MPDKKLDEILKFLGSIPGVEIESVTEIPAQTKPAAAFDPKKILRSEMTNLSFDDLKKVPETIDVPFNDPVAYSVPLVDRVVFSGPATTIIWSDGQKTTVKCSEGQEYDRYAGFCAAVCKRLFGSTLEAKKILDNHDTHVLAARLDNIRIKRRIAEEARQARARLKKSRLKEMSYAEFSKQVNERVIDAMIQRAADEKLKLIDADMNIKATTDEIMKAMQEKEQKDVPDT